MEIPLTGGRMTPGVVRVGDTVRRPRRPDSEQVGRWLTLLREQGCSFVQEFLGFDERDRASFRYIPGVCPPELGMNTGEQLLEFLSLVRRMHDASQSFLPSGQVLCHHDLSPCNAIFSAPLHQPGSRPVGIIDWDACAPGPRWEDLAYALWLWLDLGNDELDPERSRLWVTRALDAYGASPEDRRQLDERIIARMLRVAESAATRPSGADTVAWAQGCARWAAAHRWVFSQR